MSRAVTDIPDGVDQQSIEHESSERTAIEPGDGVPLLRDVIIEGHTLQ
jgi:hypothetical protein